LGIYISRELTIIRRTIMDLYNKVIRDIKDLIEAVKDANDQFQGQVWWRGQGDFEWYLLPKVYRPPPKGYNYEQNIILRFQQRAPSRYHNCPPLDKRYSWLFLMQHYGLPTRLLDWTESPLTAGFFAVCEQKHWKKDGALYALNPYLLNDLQIRKNELLMPENEKARSLARKAFDKNAEDLKSIIAILPSEVDIRLMVQLSVFTVHGSSLSLDDVQGNVSFLKKYKIQAEAKRLLKNQFKYLGIRESSLYPDIDHLAKDTAALRFKKPTTRMRDNDEDRRMDPGYIVRDTSSST
jgi:hypothetical protein